MGKAFVFYRPTNDCNYIVIPYKTNYKTILHEIGHCVNGDAKRFFDNKKMITPYDWLMQELKADLYTYNTMGKRFPFKRILYTLLGIIELNVNPKFAYYPIIDLFNSYHIPLSKKQKRILRGFSKVIWRWFRSGYLQTHPCTYFV
jgi:hypothetical protein